jgi:hypothetical protein
MTEERARYYAKALAQGLEASPSTLCAAAKAASWQCKYHRTTAKSSRQSRYRTRARNSSVNKPGGLHNDPSQRKKRRRVGDISDAAPRWLGPALQASAILRAPCEQFVRHGSDYSRSCPYLTGRSVWHFLGDFSEGFGGVSAATQRPRRTGRAGPWGSAEGEAARGSGEGLPLSCAREGEGCVWMEGGRNARPRDGYRWLY